MTTIALFGGTGKTGSRVLTRLLDQGHAVRVLVRDPARLRPSQHPALTVITGDVTAAAAVRQAVEGADAVLSLFGQVKGSPPRVQTEGTRAIIAAMQEFGVRRIVSLSGGGLPDPVHDRPTLADRAIRGIMRVAAGQVLDDAADHLRVLEQSGLDWTVVRAPRLTEAPGVGRYRVGWVGVDASTQISRDDLADFIVTQIDDRRFVRQLPFVSA
jgi:uncharacterized protein YbjT (DUF2867 family)